VETVGVRELRQHLSRYLKRVANGERLVVTERRRQVAVLGPLPEEDDILEYLIATGEATRPAGDLLDVEPWRGTDGGPLLSETLREMREERL